ncbi:MAG: nucleotidyltransferase domain-containing protein [Candidatus Shapirobacteria bacterium]
MASIVLRLSERGLIKPPSYAKETQYEVITGSIAYGVSSDMSDCDIVGFCIPSKEVVFPHLGGEIQGFGTQIKRFDQYQQHHISDKEADREYDITVYNIVKFFQLCMDNNPNMVDCLFVDQRCILHSTKIGNMVRDARKDFLHKGSWYKFKGYSFSQLHKMKTKNPEGKRVKIIEQFGFDTKFALHVIRLLDEVEQILLFGDLDLTRSREHLKAIRRGEVPYEEIEKYFYVKEKELEKLYHSSSLPYKPDEPRLKTLLINCLEEFYGSLDKCIKISGTNESLLKDLKTLVSKYE